MVDAVSCLMEEDCIHHPIHGSTIWLFSVYRRLQRLVEKVAKSPGRAEGCMTIPLIWFQEQEQSCKCNYTSCNLICEIWEWPHPCRKKATLNIEPSLCVGGGCGGRVWGQGVRGGCGGRVWALLPTSALLATVEPRKEEVSEYMSNW